MILSILGVARSATGFWATLFVVAIGITASTAALVSKDVLAPGDRGLLAWLKPKPLSILFLSVMGGLGAMNAAQGLFSGDAQSTRNQLESLESMTNTLVDRTNPVTPQPARVRLKLPGLWGETNCGVTYRFTLRDNALIVDSVRQPAGTNPYHLIATVTRSEGDIMEVRGERPQAARGRAATFTYASNGDVEHLTWDDQSGPVPLELDRCE